MKNYFKKQIGQFSVFGRCRFAHGAIFSGNCGAQSGNIFLKLFFGDDGADDSAKARIEQLMRHKYQVRTETISEILICLPLG
jgi:hypothetical protein